MGGPASSTTAEIQMQAHERIAISMALHPPKVWDRFVDDVYFSSWKTFSNISAIFIKILSLLWRRKVMENQRFLKRNNGEISVLVYRKPIYTDQYLHYSSHHQTSCKESIVSYLFNRAYSIVTNKDELDKESTRIKQVLKVNGYQESIISRIFKRITNNHCLPQSNQLT